MEQSHWRRVILIFAATGIALAGYLTWYEAVIPVGACPIDVGYISCQTALSSSYSRFGDVSVASLGLLWFMLAIVLGFALPRRALVLKVLLAWSTIGVIGIALLVGIEVFMIGEICSLCTVGHVFGLGIIVSTVKLWLNRQAA